MKMDAVATTTAETMRFTDHAVLNTNKSANPLESTFMLADTQDRVEGFFSRPQRIASYEWSPNVAFHEVFNPWDLYFSNDKVRERLSNFAWLRCTLRLKIMINSTKFYYGRMMSAYTPMHLNDNITAFRPGVQEDFMEASQRPCVIMDPTNDEVGEMTLPYMYPKSALNVPAREWTRMGQITLADLTVLRNANNATDSITVTVFAWAEDVDYSQPTSLVYTNEGGEEEYFDGPISKPAHKVARFANHLADVPYIGLYARATSMIASAGAAVARLFGYSRPTIADSEHLYTPYYGKRLAATNVEDTCDPLSLDVKKEIPIDPRVIGAPPDDHMAFVPLGKRETYITSFQWDANAAADTFLFNMHVHPLQRSYETPTVVHTTPAAWVASLFRYWRGTMKIRFEVVASGFHRGRLRILYDPLTQITSEYNVNYTHTVDLCNKTDYTMEVGWGQNLPYLQCDHLNSGNESHSTTPFTNRVGNGILSVFVVNSLTAPSDQIQPVTVNVYASMMDDFEVQDPYGLGLRNLGLPENNLFPPSIEPADPPDDLINNEELRAVGPLTFGNFFNNPFPSDFILSTPSLAQFEPGGIVFGGEKLDQSYANPTAMQITGLASGDQEILIEFTTRDVPSTPQPDFILAGVSLPFIETEPGVYIARFEEVVNVPVSTVTLSTSWAGTNVLVISQASSRRSVATGTRFAGDITFRPGNIGFTSDVYGDYYSIGQDETLRIDNPGELIVDIQVRGNIGDQIIVNNSPGTIESSDFPSRLNNAATQNASVIEIRNPNPENVLVYGYTWREPLFANEGGSEVVPIPIGDDPRISAMYYFGRDLYYWLKDCDLFTYEQFVRCAHSFFQHQCPSYFTEGGTEEEVQPERLDVQESAAGTDTNLPAPSDVFFGENPSSFRQVMKRYTLVRYLAVASDERRRFTLYANPRNTARGQVQPADVSIWSWVMTPYLGWKGSTRHKIISESANNGVATISRYAQGSFAETEVLMTPGDQANVAWEGSTTAFLGRQVAEAVIPWYSNFRFRNCRIGNPDISFEEAPAFNVELTSPNRDLVVRQVAAGGEDYSLHYWVSTPIVNVG